MMIFIEKGDTECGADFFCVFKKGGLLDMLSLRFLGNIQDLSLTLPVHV